jgi:outer membrane biosynthesis protein TonB
MANDLTDVLRDQLQRAVREFAENLANGSEKERPSSRFSGLKAAVVGAGLALAAKKGIDAARQNPGLIEGVSSRISAKLEELQGREEEPEDEVEEEPEPEVEEPEEEPSAEAEEEAEADAEAEAEPESEADEESEPEAKPKPAPKRKPRSTPSRRSAKPEAGSRAKKRASTSTRRSSKSS